MANEVSANEVIAPRPEVALSEADYRAFCGALEVSGRGRAFLAEYARRNRHADTEVVLAALDRLEALVRSQSAGTEADRIRQELRALLAALAGAQPAIDASAAAIKAAKLAALIEFVQHRIESIVAHERSPLPAEVAALLMAGEAEPARRQLAVVPKAEEPELPIPAPAAGPPPAIALVQREPETAVSPHPCGEGPGVRVVVERQIDCLAAATPLPNPPPQGRRESTEVAVAAVLEPAVDTIVAETAAPVPPAFEEIAFAPAFVPMENRISVAKTAAPIDDKIEAPQQSSDDPLALIMALSEAERIALFT